MDDLNNRADKAINNLFHNIVDLQQSEARLNKRKDNLKSTHQHMVYSIIVETTVIVAIAWWQIFYLTSMMDRKLIV